MSRPTHKPNLTGAQRIICEDLKTIGSESTGLLQCLSRVVRRDIVSKRAYPALDTAARDGYCFQAAATLRASSRRPAVFRLRGTIRSGDRPVAGMERGQCVRIMTGGILPQGADAVMPAEDVRADGEYVEVARFVESGTHVRKAGEVAGAGDKVAARGDFVGPGLLGLLAAVGIRRASVSRRVRIGIVSTGNELVGSGNHPRSWQIHDSNSVMLAGLGQELGAEVIRLGAAKDAGEDIVGRLRAGRVCDLVILTGGSSTGISDFVPDALVRYGCRILIRGIRLRPGKHVVFARKGGKVFFGLPGRPGGCFGLFHLLVKPAIMAMMGAAEPIPVALKAVWDGGPTERPAVDTLLPAHLGSDCRVRTTRDRGSVDLAAVAGSNALALLKAGRGLVSKGDMLEVFQVRLPSKGRDGRHSTYRPAAPSS